jgi:acetamidase/formamidase
VRAATYLLGLTLGVSATLPSLAAAEQKPNADAAALSVPSTPANVTWGDFPADKPPVLRVPSGQTVRIDTLSQAGTTQDEHPVDYLAKFGVKREEVLKDVLDFWESKSARPRPGRGPHIMTGPIFVEGAAPGDMLEVQILDVTTRVPYGLNNSGPTSGVLDPNYAGHVGPFYSGKLDPNYPGRLSTTPPAIPAHGPVGNRTLIRTATVGGREVALFSADITIPLAPFMGVMAVSPAEPVIGAPGVTVSGVQSSTPPGAFGGNMDVKDLKAGSTLYLPVFHPGALFYVGDPHSAQGDGEVSGTAIEHSLTGTFRFVVHKGKTIRTPRAEDATHYILMGIDLDLDRAMRLATQEVVLFLVEEKGLTLDKAYSLASIAVDFHVAEAVDQTQIITGKIPKNIFK